MFTQISQVPTPDEFKSEIPLPAALKAAKANRDGLIRDVLSGASNKFLLIIGPCSADDPVAVLDYTLRLAKAQERVSDSIVIVPRVYTNKPRTTGRGYKGMATQPDPAAAPDLNAGIRAIRRLHISVLEETGLSSADEMLYPENLAYVDDLLSYHAVGARSVENQLHRLVASGIDAPVGMKNPASGDISVLFNSISAAQTGHTFLYRAAEVETLGNPLAHAVLRGSVNRHGESIPNYHFEDLERVLAAYTSSEYFNPAVIVDLNHNNSNKRHSQQPRILREVLGSMRFEPAIKKMVKGMMCESYIVEGAQAVCGGVYGKSITDSCLSWEDSERLIYELAEAL